MIRSDKVWHFADVLHFAIYYINVLHLVLASGFASWVKYLDRTRASLCFTGCHTARWKLCAKGFSQLIAIARCHHNPSTVNLCMSVSVSAKSSLEVCQPSRHQNCQLATSCLKKLLNPKAIHSKMEVAWGLQPVEEMGETRMSRKRNWSTTIR